MTERNIVELAELLADAMNIEPPDPEAGIYTVDVLDWLASAGLGLTDDGTDASIAYLTILGEKAITDG